MDTNLTKISTLFHRPRDVSYHWRHVSSSSWTMKNSQSKYLPRGQWWPPSACVPVLSSSSSNDIHQGLHPQRCTTSNSSGRHRQCYQPPQHLSAASRLPSGLKRSLSHLVKRILIDYKTGCFNIFQEPCSI